MKKYLVVLGLTAMMLFAVGCNEKDTVEYVNNNTVYTVSDESAITVTLGDWYDAIEEILGEDFDPDKLESVEGGLVYNNDLFISYEYIDEVAYDLAADVY